MCEINGTQGRQKGEGYQTFGGCCLTHCIEEPYREASHRKRERERGRHTHSVTGREKQREGKEKSPSLLFSLSLSLSLSTMSLTQYLLCPLVLCLGSLCFSLAMAGESVTGIFVAAPQRDLTTVSNLDLPSAEVETDTLWAEEEMADRSVVEMSLTAESIQEEFNSSPSWNSGVHEDRGLSSDANSPAPLVPSAPWSVTVTSESGAFASLPQAWDSPGTESRPLSRGEEQAVPATSPTSATFTRTTLATVSPRGETLGVLDDIATTTGSDSGDRRDGLDALPPGTSSAGESDASDFPTTSYSSPQPPQLLPENTVLTGAVATASTGSNAVTSQGLPITGRKGMGFTMTDPDHVYSLEATSKMVEPGFIPQDSSGTKPTAAREEPQETTQQVICRDWSKLAGKSYVILNMTENTECEVFRSLKGLKLLKLVAESFSRKLSTPTDSWLMALSKPSEDDKHLLMMLASDRGTIPAKEVLAMLGDVKENLKEIGIHNVTSATGCQGRPSQPRGDYGKLFIVLVIIGSICAVIIVSGLVYICWQRRLPKLKNMVSAVPKPHVPWRGTPLC
ncbi:podocalyxin-like protein 2 isoform X3 [Carcharodon carcharias]|uniref:podocalyxin-like protein 2 isoform X3 n=1 Tax=Carcharodon carcharias TaxID=13397 RepID=UPI001B7E7E7D|nr:podocalyxin-like protein 2 isoform X3 [Carcharodon carcharias]